MARSRSMVVRSQSPILRIAVPRAAPAVRARPRARHRRGGSRGAPLDITTAAISGLALSLLDKVGLPEIPVVGKTGSIAIIAYFLSKQGGQIGAVARVICTVSVAMAAKQMLDQGHVSGVSGYDTV